MANFAYWIFRGTLAGIDCFSKDRAQVQGPETDEAWAWERNETASGRMMADAATEYKKRIGFVF